MSDGSDARQPPEMPDADLVTDGSAAETDVGSDESAAETDVGSDESAAETDVGSDESEAETDVGSDGSAAEEVASDGSVPVDDPALPPDADIGRGLFQEGMGPSSAMAHLYRGEVHRMNRWRERLDRTTHWAVTVLVAVLTYTFANASNPHYVILFGLGGVGFFLGIEARRFRGYDMWRSRVRVLQENVFAHALDESGPTAADWREALADHYRRAEVTMPFEEAVAHRLRRVYLPLVGITVAAWALRVTSFTTTPWPASATIGPVPGRVVTALVTLVAVCTVAVAFRPREWHVEGEIQSADLELLHDR